MRTMMRIEDVDDSRRNVADDDDDEDKPRNVNPRHTLLNRIAMKIQSDYDDDIEVNDDEIEDDVDDDNDDD